MDTKLITPESLKDEALKDELESILKKDHGEALTNLIKRKTPQDMILDRPARGNITVRYVPGWWFIQQANALFGHNWSFEILRAEILTDKKHVWVQGVLSVNFPGRTERIVHPDGTIVESTIDPITVKKTQFGGCDIKYKKDSTTIMIDLGDDLKSAATDCMKKCFTLFGFAADIYGPRDTESSAAGSKQQLKALYSVGQKIDMTIDQVDAWVIEETDKQLDELVQLDVLSLIAKLRDKVKAAEADRETEEVAS